MRLPFPIVAATAGLLLAPLGAAVPPARAQTFFQQNPEAKDVVKCTRAINKETAKYLKLAHKTVDKCKAKVIGAGVGPNGETTLGACAIAAQLTPGSKLSAKRQKLLDAIAKKCGGKDQTCGAPLAPPGTDEDLKDLPLDAIHWDIGSCMNFEAGSGPGPECDQAIDSCADVGACLACIVDRAVEQGVDGLVYDHFVSAHFATGSAENKCQAAVAKAAGKFLLGKHKVLSKCYDGKLKGKAQFSPTAICPDADLAGKSLAKIVKAEEKKVKAICKKCGGGALLGTHPNFACERQEPSLAPPFDGPGGFIPGVVEEFQCPAVAVPPTAVHPAGQDCGAIGTVDTLAKYLACLDCVLEFKADCAAAAATGVADAEGFPYFPECVMALSNVALGRPVTASSVSGDQTGAKAVDGDLATNWSAGALPPQWIEIDLVEQVAVKGIRLLVSQSPSGDTEHQVSFNGYVHTFSQPTSNRQWLSHTLADPLPNVRRIRIDTLSSPSWVAWFEIQVLSPTVPCSLRTPPAGGGWCPDPFSDFDHCYSKTGASCEFIEECSSNSCYCVDLLSSPCSGGCGGGTCWPTPSCGNVCVEDFATCSVHGDCLGGGRGGCYDAAQCGL